MTYIHHSTRRAIRQKAKAGFKIAAIAKEHGCTQKLVRQIVNGEYNIPDPAPYKRPQLAYTEHQRAVAELRREGYSDEAICSVFGPEAVDATPRFG